MYQSEIFCQRGRDMILKQSECGLDKRKLIFTLTKTHYISDWQLRLEKFGLELRYIF